MDADYRLDLYFHTLPARARKIVRERKIRGRDGFVTVSDTPYGFHTVIRGEVAVHVRVPADLPELVADFRNGEHLYRVPVDQADIVGVADLPSSTS